MLFTEYTWQDWVSGGNHGADPAMKSGSIMTIINKYKVSPMFMVGRDANLYFAGASPVIGKKTMLRANVVTVENDDGIQRNRVQNEEVVGNRIASNFYHRMLAQEVQYLLGNGVTLESPEIKNRLGYGFDKAVASIGEKALLHGACYAFWNLDHVEILQAVRDAYSGFVAVLDEVTSRPMLGVQFWRIASDKPLCVRLFEVDGITMYREGGNSGKLSPISEKVPYKTKLVRDALGDVEIGAEGYGGVLPIIPMYADEQANSTLTPSIKSKIDLYDRILSDFGDNLDRANDVYWVLNNFGGDVASITTMFEYISKLKAVINQSDGMGGNATAEPKTLEVPYQARSAALELLRKALYDDFMALDTASISGGSLTNVAIKVAYANLDLKTSRFEWQVFGFVQEVLRLIGIQTEQIRFVRQNLVNDQEVIQNIYLMRSDIDHETALRLNPYIMEEEIPRIIENVNAEGQTGFDSVDAIQSMLDEEGGDAE